MQNRTDSPKTSERVWLMGTPRFLDKLERGLQEHLEEVQPQFWDAKVCQNCQDCDMRQRRAKPLIVGSDCGKLAMFVLLDQRLGD
jgi:hypothetical protein